MAQLDRELNEMAEKILNKESNMRLKSLGKRIKSGFSCFGRVNAMLLVAIVMVIFAVALPSISRYYRKANKSSVQNQSEVLGDKDKHWANVLVLIHKRDVNRAAEIIAEVDKPNRLLEDSLFSKEYENRSYLVTRELEEILKINGIRYQRKEFDNDTALQYAQSNPYGHIHVLVEPSPWINW